jgi:hypothetical protein
MQVTLIDHMGSDLSVVNAARVSFNEKSDREYAESEQRILGGTDVLISLLAAQAVTYIIYGIVLWSPTWPLTLGELSIADRGEGVFLWFVISTLLWAIFSLMEDQ